jgi:hypothetical protein
MELNRSPTSKGLETEEQLVRFDYTKSADAICHLSSECPHLLGEVGV